MFEILLLLQKKRDLSLSCSLMFTAVTATATASCAPPSFSFPIFFLVLPTRENHFHFYLGKYTERKMFFSSGRCSPQCPLFSAHLAQQSQDDIMFMRILHTAICWRLLSTSKYSLCQVCVTESVLWNTFHPFMEEIKCFHWCVVLMGCLERQVPPKWHHYVRSKIVWVQQKDLWFLRRK